MRWITSSKCDTGTCVEVGTEVDEFGNVLVRNSTEPEQVVCIPQDQWNLFLQRVREGAIVGIEGSDVDNHLIEIDRNARAYGYEIGRGHQLVEVIETTDEDNPFLDPDWRNKIAREG